ncbi:translocation/assembly module TamB domain-containing protein [Bizionia saleffrena]|uniref:translocation/assembly module TamB domain-containing protein n=1 Tax=Bizionia saleffrena TaxID=291189 RepID=UPI001FE6A0DC|nr:translocation/assembly module TamB domain-containing protein [Bizionia saleffrena]
MDTTENIETQPPKKRKHRIVRRTLSVLLGVILLLLLVILFIRSPWGQNIIVAKAVDYVSNKTNTNVVIDKLFITFNGNIQLEGLFLEDKKGDTLVYSKSLEADVPLFSMIKGGAIGVEQLNWKGLRANIIRKDSISGYNFQFLIDAFAPADTTNVAADTTTSKPLDLILRTFNFKDIDIVFDDAVAGIDSRFKIGKFDATMNTTNMEMMVFEASNIALKDAKIKFIQKPVAADTTTSKIPLPKFSVETLSLQNVTAYYESQPDRIIADLDIDEFYTEIPQINLIDNDINFKTIRLKNSKIRIHTDTEVNGLTETVKNTKEEAKATIKSLNWPQLLVTIDAIDLENNAVDYRVGNAKPIKNSLNLDAISLSEFTLKASDVFLKDKKAGLQMNQFTSKAFSGLHLKQLAFNLNVTDKQLHLENFNFKLNNNAISGFANLNYTSLAQLIKTPETTKVQLDLPAFSVSLKDIFKLQPELRKNPYMDSLSNKLITGNLKASGTLAAIKVSNTNVNWGKTSKLSVNGIIKNSTKPALLYIDIPNFSAQTKRSDIIQFIDEKELSVSLPEDVLLDGSVKGTRDAIEAQAKLTSNQGIATIKGHFKNTDTVSFDADILIDDYKVNELLNDPQFGALNLTITASGSGNNINALNAKLNATVSSFQLNNYDIKNLNINGDIKDGKGKINSKYKDKNLDIALDAAIVLDSISPEASIELDIIGADLQALGVMDRNVKTGMKIFADFKGNGSNYDVSTHIDNGVVIYDNRTYLLGDLKAKAHVDKDTTSVWVTNKMLNLVVQSNSDPQTFSNSLRRHVLSYFYDDERAPDTIARPVNLKLEGRISESPLLNDVFLVNVKDLDTIDVSVNYNEKARILIANITAPHINYSGNKLDSLAFSMMTDKNDFNFNLGFKSIEAGPLLMPKTVINGNQTDNGFLLNFLGYHDGETLLNVNTKITTYPKGLRFTVSPDSLILNKQKWTIPDSNEVIITDKKFEYNDFKISRGNQSIEITDKLERISKSHMAIAFKNFSISEFFSYFNPETSIAKGNLNGDFILEEPFKDTGIIAALTIDQLEVLKTDLGVLKLDAKSLGGSNYDFNAGLKGGDIDLDLTGDYGVTNKSANLNLDLDINTFKMKALNTLTLGEIKDTEGSFSGGFKVTGTTANPQYKGAVTFNDAGFNIAKLNTKFTLVNETLKVDNKGLSLSNFTILDANKNALILSGTIGTENALNPTFNLEVKANNFQILNATKKDNTAFYGKASFNANARLTGDLQIPKLNAELTLGSDTDITYVMPSTLSNIEERDGVVVFVNRENPDAILSQTDEQTATIRGFDISSVLKIGKDAAVTIVIDEETGDNFKVSGEGDFIFTMTPNGRITLTGGYEISSGHYELNLYNLVNRKFLIAPGSRVTWSGDPFDAKLDVRAIYNIETSASALMAPQISGADPSVKSKYRQVLPFNVYLNIDGELLQPKISFGLDMPEEQQGAIGGQVYGRVQQVNQQEGELNRQVFSLLVLNRFYPDSGSDGSSGGFATIARDNLNDAVSGQLNAFSDKLLGSSGIEVDFGLNSYTDYQGDAPTDRTQLDIAAQKKLFNDRLTVRVGSDIDLQGSSPAGEEAPLIGNVSLEYTLTEDGRYRLKGFRKSEFENVIDGQTIVSGIGLIFTQEFNQFNELWDAIFRSRQEQKEKRDAKRDAIKEKLKAKEEKINKSIEQKKN